MVNQKEKESHNLHSAKDKERTDDQVSIGGKRTFSQTNAGQSKSAPGQSNAAKKQAKTGSQAISVSSSAKPIAKPQNSGQTAATLKSTTKNTATNAKDSSKVSQKGGKSERSKSGGKNGRQKGQNESHTGEVDGDEKINNHSGAGGGGHTQSDKQQDQQSNLSGIDTIGDEDDNSAFWDFVRLLIVCHMHENDELFSKQSKVQQSEKVDEASQSGLTNNRPASGKGKNSILATKKNKSEVAGAGTKASNGQIEIKRLEDESVDLETAPNGVLHNGVLKPGDQVKVEGEKKEEVRDDADQSIKKEQQDGVGVEQDGHLEKD